ncbi:MAG: hypothetical protein KF847_10590 [Pirellulales bacterium]|nr:hypothetical protein [Pirellulales bacterium]
MNQAVAGYFERLNSAAGAAWNRFWFEPTTAATLGRVRAAVGLLALAGIASYGPDLARWFGPEGMLPLSIVREFYPEQWSLLDYVSGGGLWAVYGLGIAVAAALAAGIGGRGAAVATLVLTLSFSHRAPMTTGEFEAVLAFLLAYVCVGRAGDDFSLAARLGAKPAPVPAAANTVAVRLIQVHVAAVHALMAMAMFAAKDGVWFSGEGLWLAAARPGGALVDLAWLNDHPKPVALASHLVTAYFVALPLLVWRPLMRPLVLAAAAIVWPLLAVTTGSVLFCLAMAAGTLAFVDPAAWTRSRT